jgi:hypothetical protein
VHLLPATHTHTTPRSLHPPAGKWFLQRGTRIRINNVGLHRREDQVRVVGVVCSPCAVGAVLHPAAAWLYARTCARTHHMHARARSPLCRLRRRRACAQWGGKWGDPNEFNPDRFMPGAAEETGRHPNAFKCVPSGWSVPQRCAAAHGLHATAPRSPGGLHTVLPTPRHTRAHT